MKILIACDGFIRPEMLGGFTELERSGIKVEMFENELLTSADEFTEYMIKTEQEGPEAVEAGQAFIEAAADADILVVHLTPVNKKVIDAAKNLRYVGIMRGGCDNVNLDMLHKKGILASNAPWRSAYAVADFTVGLMLAETKNIARSHSLLMNGKWEKNYVNSSYYMDMRNRTIGLIGFGHIGQKVAAALRGFESNVIVHDPFMDDEIIKSMGYQPMSLDDLLRSSDIVSMHMRLSDKTRDMIGKRELELMKPTATLINTARAGLVNQEALIEALTNGQIMGAALDVFEQEPLPKEHPYMQLSNITITPHLAGTSNDTVKNAIDIVLEDVHRFINGEELKCRV